MTINEAINITDALKHNAYTEVEKIQWLSKLDWMVKTHILDTHEGAAEVEFSGYDADTDGDTELLVPAPFDAMYQRWLEAQIDLASGEYNKYNVAILLFNTEYESFESHYHRNHRPIPDGKRFLF